MQSVVFHVENMIFGSTFIKVSGNALFQVPFYASINELEGTGPLWHPVPIETLPDVPLLESSSFYVEGIYEACDLVQVSGIKLLEAWCTLVHVCQRWRNLVFASPRAACLHKRNIRKGNIERLVFLAHCRESSIPGILFPNWHGENRKNVVSIILIAALESRCRICQIALWKPLI